LNLARWGSLATAAPPGKAAPPEGRTRGIVHFFNFFWKIFFFGGGRVLIVKVMVGGGRRSIWAAAELGEVNACVNEGAELPKCKGTRLEPMSGTACDVQLKSIENGKQ
jgi:hypothetical protein